GDGAADAAARATRPAPPASAPASAKGERSTVTLSRVQQTIARRMAESRATIPDFELRCQVDMTAAVQLREQLRAVADPPPSFNDLIVKAAALALVEFPRVNGSYRDAELELHSRVNVGIAVAAEDALLVPTIFDADRRSLREIAAAARELAARVRDRTVTPAQLSGATFSVSNLGMYGIDSFSAVINPPQAAILAVGSLRPRAVVSEEGLAVARPTVELTLACDHRVLYGADGARFLARVRELLESPLALLLGDSRAAPGA
ncbi:MAG: 2-oxo acid dehydrogenase subunit E2, partial [Solirubrobacteraceae bacterium]